MPRLKLTAKTVESLKPTDERCDYFDMNLPGFFIRVTPNGVKTYGVMYRHAGRKVRFTIGTTEKWSLADAREKGQEAIRQAAKGHDPAQEKKDQRLASSFGELAADYMERWARKRKREKSWKEDQRIISVYLKRFDNIKASEVSRADVRVMLEEIADKHPIQANRTLACIRKIYNWGIGVDLVETSPCVKLMAPGKEQRRDRVLSDEELKKIWAALQAEDSPVADTYKLRLLTAQRGGEVLSMRWADVDLDNRWWTIPAERSKNKMPHRVWLSDPVIRILRQAQKRNDQRKKRAGGPSPWVFPGKRKGKHLVETKNVKADVAEAAKVDDWIGHDLRRTAASYMGSLGIPRLVIGRVLNHAEPEVTAVYDRHSYDAEKKDALERWAKRLMVLVSSLQDVSGTSFSS